MTKNIYGIERVLLAVVLSTLSLGAGLDITAGRIRSIADFVPSTFRSVSWLSISRDHLSGQRIVLAEAAARNALLRRPLDASVLVTLDELRVERDSTQGSDSLAVAARLGWRNAEVQHAVFSTAIKLSAWEVASSRVVALTRLHKLYVLNASEFADPAYAPVFYSLNRQFVNNKGYWISFFRWLGSSNPHAAEFFLGTMTKSDKIVDCESFVSALNFVVRTGHLRAADLAMDDSCAHSYDRAQDSIAFREGFGTVLTGPFDWKFARDSSIKYAKIKIDRLYVEPTNSAHGDRLFASKLVKLRPGKFKINLIFPKSVPVEVREGPRFLLHCLSDTGSITTELILNRSLEFSVKDGNCTYLRLSLYIGPDEIQAPFNVGIENI